MLKRLFNAFLNDLTADILPPVQSYAPPARPQREIQKQKKGEEAPTSVIGGHGYILEQIDKQHYEMNRIGSVPETPAQVILDRFDLTVLYSKKGEKDEKAKGMYRVVKWHWLQEHSAGTIEQLHTSKSTGQVQKGFSKRSVAEYIAMLYDADNEREREGERRLRETPKNPPPSNAIEL